jgi:hypothetical protein
MARIVAALVLLVAAVGARAQLQDGFYAHSCPRAEQIVRDYVEEHIPPVPSVAATLLRTHFHDCFVRVTFSSSSSSSPPPAPMMSNSCFVRVTTTYPSLASHLLLFFISSSSSWLLLQLMMSNSALHANNKLCRVATPRCCSTRRTGTRRSGTRCPT